MEEDMTKAQVDAGRWYIGDKNKSVSRLIHHPKITNPISETEQSLELILAQKFSKRSKRDLRGLWETLAPSSTAVRTSPTTTAIKEPGVPEVKVRNSDIAKFGPRPERNTELWQYAQRRPLPHDKTTEEKSPKTPKNWRKNTAVILKLDIDHLKQIILLESLQRTALFERQCRRESRRNPKPGQVAHASRQQHQIHPTLRQLQLPQRPLWLPIQQPRSPRLFWIQKLGVLFDWQWINAGSKMPETEQSVDWNGYPRGSTTTTSVSTDRNLVPGWIQLCRLRTWSQHECFFCCKSIISTVQCFVSKLNMLPVIFNYQFLNSKLILFVNFSHLSFNSAMINYVFVFLLFETV